VDPGDLVVTPTYERFREIVDAFAGRRVVVLGDLVADEFLHGELARVSREAPVLVLDQKRIELVPGGAGNAVANLRSLDASPVPVGVVGRDDSGERLLATFRRLRIDTSGITSPAGYETPAKSRILAGGVHTRRQQVVRIDRGSPRGDLTKAAQATLTGKLARAVKGADGLLVADYGYGAATPGLVARTKGALGKRPVTVDSRARVARYRGVTACTPNHEELR